MVAGRCTSAARRGAASEARTTRPVSVRARDRRPGAPSPMPGTRSSRARNGIPGGTASVGPSWLAGRALRPLAASADRRPVGAVAGRGARPVAVGPASGGGAPPPPPSGSGSGSGSGSASRRASSSADSSTPGSSNGSRRRRCGSASRAATRTSCSATTSAPRQAAWASAARAITRSARIPSTSNAAHTAAIRRSSASGSSDRAQPGLRGGDPARPSRPRRRTSAAANPHRVGLEGHPPPHHLHPGVHVPRRAHLDGQPEAVQQLRAQLPLLRVHRADQQEPGRVRHRHPVPLDVRAAHRRGVQQQVDQVVVQQVDLVDVEHAAVRLGQQPGLVGAHPLGQRPLQVERPDQPVLGGPDRQLDEPGRPVVGRAGRVRPVRAGRVRVGRRAAEPAAGHHVQRGQQRGQRAHGRRLGGALLAAHQHPADPGVHGVQQQREPQVVVPDHGGEREPRDGRLHAHGREPARPVVTIGNPAGAP